MRVISIRPLAGTPVGAAGVVAFFDAEVAEGIRINRLALRRNRAGQLRVFGPRSGDAALAYFTPSLAIKLTEAAIAALEEGNTPDDRLHAA